MGLGARHAPFARELATMQYRSFPKLPNLPISSLGFGAMRLPVVGGDPARIDEEAATGMIHEAVGAGVSYIDTAWVYHSGQSERFLGTVLSGGLRKKVQLATKCPVWEVKAAADFDRLLDAQLERLRSDRIARRSTARGCTERSSWRGAGAPTRAAAAAPAKPCARSRSPSPIGSRRLTPP